jgi:hypothetical protein
VNDVRMFCLSSGSSSITFTLNIDAKAAKRALEVLHQVPEYSRVQYCTVMVLYRTELLESRGTVHQEDTALPYNVCLVFRPALPASPLEANLAKTNTFLPCLSSQLFEIIVVPPPPLPLHKNNSNKFRPQTAQK